MLTVGQSGGNQNFKHGSETQKGSMLGKVWLSRTKLTFVRGSSDSELEPKPSSRAPMLKSSCHACSLLLSLPDAWIENTGGILDI